KPMTAKRGGYYIMPYGTEVTGYNNSFAYDSVGEVSIRTVTSQEMENISEIYPNPAKEQVSVTLNNNQPLYYRIVNLKGQVMQTGKINASNGAVNMDVSSLKSGNYWVVFTDGNFSATRKLVVTK
ncbi:MAG: T9SS type A sorting domain-containing protein, partial [Bacteroidales bacterium]|nr:T9SS type A sorting domain-containing protein [Bacteroidales bacterium]